MRLRGNDAAVLLVTPVLLGLLIAGRVSARSPDIVLIVADDLGYSDLGSFGGEIETPVLDPREPAATASRLAARVGQSGVFFEAHLAQWMRGDRGADAVRSEAQQLARVALADPARAEARTAVQFEALHRDAVALSGPAWAGQPMRLELGRDPQVLPDGGNGAAGDAPPVFFARLRLELPRLGAVEVRLRLAGESIAATVESAGAASSAELDQALPEFAAALTARGLRPVLLQALVPAEVA